VYDETDFSIKYNNAASNDPCEICGARTDPEVGPELFMRESWALVCYECGEKYAPELTGLLLDYRRRRDLEDYLDEHPGTAVILDHGEEPPPESGPSLRRIK
jgi:hypothetical protein